MDASQVSRLLTSLSALSSPPPPNLASELGKSAAARFASPAVPPSELADLVWAFARLGVKLPPAFASSAQRRLQLAMSQLPAAQLSRMVWSIASAGYNPTEPQLRAYAQKVRMNAYELYHCPRILLYVNISRLKHACREIPKDAADSLTL